MSELELGPTDAGATPQPAFVSASLIARLRS